LQLTGLREPNTKEILYTLPILGVYNLDFVGLSDGAKWVSPSSMEFNKLNCNLMKEDGCKSWHRFGTWQERTVSLQDNYGFVFDHRWNGSNI
jgi:hypothetical protein